MVRIIMNGCNGHMGQVITGLLREDAEAEIAAGIDLVDTGTTAIPYSQNRRTARWRRMS